MNRCEITLKASQWASVLIRDNGVVWTTDDFRAVGECVLLSGHAGQEIMVSLQGANHDLDNVENLVLLAHFETDAPSVELFFQCSEKAEATVNGRSVDNLNSNSLNYVLNF